MSRRYGRNQKRRHLAEIERLGARLAEVESHLAYANRRWSRAESEATHARAEAREAEARAFERFAAAEGLLKAMSEQIGAELGRALGEKMLPVAQQIMTAQRPPRLPTLSMHQSMTEPNIRIIRGSIPALAYEVATSTQEMELWRR